MTEPKAFDRELELEKLQTIKGTFDNYFNIGSSLLTGGFTAFLVLIITLYFSKQLDLLTAIIEAVLIGIVIGLAFRTSHSYNLRFLAHYEIWVKQIERKESLPSILEMEKESTKKIKPKPTTLIQKV